MLNGYFVADVAFETAEDPPLVPALCNWLDFVAKCGWLNAKKAETYQRYLVAIAPEMIVCAEDPTNFSAGKMMWLALVSAGVDPKDDAALHQLVAQPSASSGW